MASFNEINTQTESHNIPHLKSDLQSVFWHLENSGFSQLPRHTHPGVCCEHGAAKLLTRNDYHVIRHHCRTEGKKGQKNKRAGIHGVRVMLRCNSLIVVKTLVKQK